MEISFLDSHVVEHTLISTKKVWHYIISKKKNAKCINTTEAQVQF